MRSRAEVIKSALAENATKIPDDFKIPSGKIRIGELLDKLSIVPAENVKLGEFELDKNRKLLIGKKAELQLTEMELDLIIFLIESAAPVSKENLLEKVWNYAADAATRTVETHIHRLNQKVQDIFGAKLIITAEGGGYGLIKS